MGMSMMVPEEEAPLPEPEDEGSQEDDDEEEAEPIGTVEMLFPFEGDGEDELPLQQGEVVTVYAEVEGWYTGTNSEGSYGLFPANFCSSLRPLDGGGGHGGH